MDVHHQFLRLRPRIAVQLLEHPRHIAHQVDRVVPHDDNPGNVRVDMVFDDRLVDDGWRRARPATRAIRPKFTVQPTPNTVGTNRRSSAGFHHLDLARSNVGIRKSYGTRPPTRPSHVRSPAGSLSCSTIAATVTANAASFTMRRIRPTHPSSRARRGIVSAVRDPLRGFDPKATYNAASLVYEDASRDFWQYLSPPVWSSPPRGPARRSSTSRAAPA